MFDPEFFMSEYKIRDLSSGTIRLASGRYRDFADTGPREEIIHDDAIRDERQTFYCVNVPGEGAWVQDVRKNQFPDFANYSTNALSNQSGTAKRCLEDTHETNVEQPIGNQNDSKRKESQISEEMDVSEENSSKDVSSSGPSMKKRTNNLEEFHEIDKKERSGTNNTSSPQCLNLPIPNSKGEYQGHAYAVDFIIYGL